MDIGFRAGAVSLPPPKKRMSEDARAVLAFIRDHPGQTDQEIAKQLGFESDREWAAIKELAGRELVIRYTRPTLRLFPAELRGPRVWYLN